jgi:general secretion pathway protein N
MRWPRLRRGSRHPDGSASRWDSSQLAAPTGFGPTAQAADSVWGGGASTDAQRWLRQFHASRRWAIWGLLLGALLGGLLFAPAQWLADALQRASQGHLLLAEARGSVWDGSAVPVLTGGPGSRDASAPPGRLYWQLRPDWKGLVLHLRQPCCLQGTLQLHLQPGFGQYTVRLGRGPAGAAADLGQWPTAWLSGLGTPWNTLQLGGWMHLSSPGLTLHSSAGRVRVDGTLTLELRDLTSRVSPLPALGSYRLDVKGLADAGTGSQLVLRTLAGPLQLSGDGQWTGERLRFRGQAQAAAGQEAALANLLNIIGRRQGALSVISIG